MIGSPAAARVVCGEERHTIQWDSGALVTLDHADPEGERALAALGGTRCACIDTLDAWARRGNDPRLLSALTRGPGDPVSSWSQSPGIRGGRTRLGAGPAGRLRSTLSGQATGWVGYAPMSSSATYQTRSGSLPTPDRSHSFEEDMGLLAGLGSALTMRLVAIVTARLLDRTAADDPEGDSVRPALEASLFGRAVSVLRTWTGEPALEIELDVVEPGDEAVVPGGEDDVMRVALPLQWVPEVWGRDLAVVSGRLAVAVIEAGENRTTLKTVGSDFGPWRTLTIELV